MDSFFLQIVIMRHILTYYYYLNSKDDSSIVKQALNTTTTTDFLVSPMTAQTVLSVKQLHDYRTNILNTGKVNFVLHLDWNLIPF